MKIDPLQQFDESAPNNISRTFSNAVVSGKIRKIGGAVASLFLMIKKELLILNMQQIGFVTLKSTLQKT